MGVVVEKETHKNKGICIGVHKIRSIMQRQLVAHPELALGGPSVTWLYLALRETASLARTPPPAIPTLTFLGADERIVATEPVHKVMEHWKNGELVVVPKAEHGSTSLGEGDVLEIVTLVGGG